MVGNWKLNSGVASYFTPHLPLSADQQFTLWLGWVTCAEIITSRSNWSWVDVSHAVRYLKWEDNSVCPHILSDSSCLSIFLQIPLRAQSHESDEPLSGWVCVWVCVQLVCVCDLWNREKQKKQKREWVQALDIGHSWQVADRVLTAHDSDVFINHIWTRRHN